MGDQIQIYSACAGLEISVAGQVADMAFPQATIRLQSSQGGNEDVGESTDVAILVRLSDGRLRALLDHASVSDRLLSALAVSDACQFHVNDPALVRRIALEILRSDYQDHCRRLFLKAKVIELLLAALARSEGGKEHAAAIAARDILLRDPLNPPSMGELSSLVGVSQRQLSADFKQAFGLVMTEWLADWRLCRGRDLVLEGTLPIAEIAASLGYAHLSTFTAAFSKRFGVPPTRLRAGLTTI